MLLLGGEQGWSHSPPSQMRMLHATWTSTVPAHQGTQISGPCAWLWTVKRHTHIPTKTEIIRIKKVNFVSNFFIWFIHFMCVCLPAGMSYEPGQKRTLESPALELTDGWEPPCRCRELNLRPRQATETLNGWAISSAPRYHFLNSLLRFSSRWMSNYKKQDYTGCHGTKSQWQHRAGARFGP